MAKRVVRGKILPDGRKTCETCGRLYTPHYRLRLYQRACSKRCKKRLDYAVYPRKTTSEQLKQWWASRREVLKRDAKQLANRRKRMRDNYLRTEMQKCPKEWREARKAIYQARVALNASGAARFGAGTGSPRHPLDVYGQRLTGSGAHATSPTLSQR